MYAKYELSIMDPRLNLDGTVEIQIPHLLTSFVTLKRSVSILLMSVSASLFLIRIK